MRTLHWVGAALMVAASIVVGCGSGGNGTCTNQYLAPAQGAGTADMCATAGGTCSNSTGASYCGPNTHPALSGSPEANSCSNNYYSDPANNCGPAVGYSAAGLVPASGTCCLPDGDAGLDASDGSDDGGDSGPQIGSCAGAPCDPGCACGLLPGPNTPACFCEGADAGADASMPTCGSIYCFAGCSCADAATSTCSCP